MFFKKIALCAALSVLTLSVHGEEISFEKGVPVPVKIFEKPEKRSWKRFIFELNKVFVILNDHGSTFQRLHSHPLSGRKELQNLVNLALQNPIQKIALVKNNSSGRYEASGLVFDKKPTTIGDFCNENCQQQLVEDYDFIAFYSPFKTTTTARVFLTQTRGNPWPGIAGGGILGAKGFTSYCQCYEDDLIFNDYTSLVQGEGRTEGETRSNALSKCQARADFVTGPDRVYVQCGEYTPIFDQSF